MGLGASGLSHGYGASLSEGDAGLTSGVNSLSYFDVEDGIHHNFGGNVHYVKVAGSPATITSFTSLYTFTGGNQSMYMGPDGLLVQSATNTPRIEYDANGNCLGLLMEAARTNLCLQSANFSTTWSRSAVNAFGAGSVVNATTSPSGSTDADFIQEDSTAGANHYMVQTFSKAASATTYSVTIFAKYNGRHIVVLFRDSATSANRAEIGVNLQTGGVGRAATASGTFTAASGSVTSLVNGWRKITLTFTTSTETTVLLRLLLDDGTFTAGGTVYNGDGTSGVYLWGAQLETGAFPSSYIPTTTGSVARTADSASRTYGSEFSTSSGTSVVQGDFLATLTPASQIVFARDTNSRFLYNATSSATATIFDGTNATSSVNTLTPNVKFKCASGFDVSGTYISLNGETVVTGAFDGTWGAGTTVSIGLGGTYNGHVYSLHYFPEKKPNSFFVGQTS